MSSDRPASSAGGPGLGDLPEPAAGPVDVTPAADAENPPVDVTAAGAESPPVDVTWRRVHKITPILNAWKVVVAVLAFFAWQLSDQLTDLPDELWETVTRYRTIAILAAAGVLLVVALAAGLYSMLAWRRMRFAITAESVDLHTGILFRQERHARLVRVQAVDVVQPLLGRLFGLAQVRVETAGGSESNVIIGYLKESEAQDVRNEVMARAAGVDVPGPTREGAGGEGTARQVAAAPEREVLQVPPGRIVGSLLLSGGLVVFLLVIAGLVVAAVLSGSMAPFFGALPAMLGWGGYLWGRFAGEFGFRAALSPDGIRLRHGLLETRTQTLPPGRVQAVKLTQALLWRRYGWWRVEVNVAGYGAADPTGQRTVETVLLPVGPRGEALNALWLVLPDLGVEDARAVLDAALEGSGEGAGFHTSPRRARLLDPLTWRRNALRITDTALLMRSGRFGRALVIVPHERTQSLALTQGPLERWRGLADLHAHSVPGPIVPVAYHLDEMLTLEILREQAGRARTARASEGPEEWMRRVAVPTATGPGDPGAPGESSAPGGPHGVAGTPAGPGDPGAPRAPGSSGDPDGPVDLAESGVADAARIPDAPDGPDGPGGQTGDDGDKGGVGPVRPG
ncbi:PH domain-containing protein [Georgenia subflava]|uniref:PH domain-containing protein n=1 Tax=Georgenia subflava TaxID=1622177 RepID=UPI001D01406E|nr:PH domain-containing protein [Georgenia subflava]